MIKKIIFIGLWLVLVAGMFVLLSFAEKEHQSLVCNQLKINIKYNSDDCFITVEDINNFLASKGIKVQGAPLYDIDADELATTLYTLPAVEKVDVFTTIEGNVEINIIQRKPIVKVFNKYRQSFYIDDKGRLMPPSDKYSARLIVANGFINDFYNPVTKLDVKDSSGSDTIIMATSIFKIFRMAQFINQDSFWKAMIEEIFINNRGEIELFTTIGDQTIFFGDIDNMKKKFENLLVFYKQGLNKVGWDKYKTINLKYKNQVVCSKI